MLSFDKMWEKALGCTWCGCDQHTKNPPSSGGQVPSKLFPDHFPACFWVCFLLGSEACLCHLLRNSENRLFLPERSPAVIPRLPAVPREPPSFLGQKSAGRQGAPSRLSAMGGKLSESPFCCICLPLRVSENGATASSRGRGKERRRATDPQGSFARDKAQGSDAGSPPHGCVASGGAPDLSEPLRDRDK